MNKFNLQECVHVDNLFRIVVFSKTLFMRALFTELELLTILLIYKRFFIGIKQQQAHLYDFIQAMFVQSNSQRKNLAALIYERKMAR